VTYRLLKTRTALAERLNNLYSQITVVTVSIVLLVRLQPPPSRSQLQVSTVSPLADQLVFTWQSNSNSEWQFLISNKGF